MKLKPSFVKRAALVGLIASSIQLTVSEVQTANATWNVLSGSGPHN